MGADSSHGQTSIILIGMKHSGKSTLARALAQGRGTPFHDLDDLVEIEHDRRRLSTVREIYGKVGPAAFAGLEARAAARLAEFAGAGPLVAALGGGTIENEPAMAVLARVGSFIYLREAEETLYGRAMAGGRPAFLSAEDPRGDFQRLFARRSELLERRADSIVEITGRSKEEAFQALVAVVAEIDNAR